MHILPPFRAVVPPQAFPPRPSKRRRPLTIQPKHTEPTLANMSSTASKRAAVHPVILHKSHIASIPVESFPDPSTGGKCFWKTLVSAPNTATDTFTAGVATCPAGSWSACPAVGQVLEREREAGQLKLHRHAHPELYHVTAGRGVVMIDGVESEVGRGSVVFIPGDAEHGIKCVGEEDLEWLYVFAADRFEEVVYRFSDVKAKL